MAQIGEFAFIIASLGLSLGVIGSFLYPVVVAVSVITTFFTPYMIRFSGPCYAQLERRMPKKWIRRLNHMGTAHQSSESEISDWRSLLHQMILQTVVYGTLCAAVIGLMLKFFLPFIRHILPHWWANGVCGVLTVLMISPFLRAIIMKKNHSEEAKSLWIQSRLNRLPLVFTVLVRILIAAGFVFYICNYLTRFTNALMISIAVVAITIMLLSRSLKRRSIMLERLFVKNLRSRDIAAQVSGKKRPLFEGHLLDRDIHISEFDVPEDSLWTGKTLRQLQFRNRFGVHVSSILRGRQRINIPNGDNVVFPCDKMQVIGNDDQLRVFGMVMKGEQVPEDNDIEKREMKLRQLILNDSSPFVGRTLKESGIRDKYNCMVVGVEEGEESLSLIDPSRCFERGDIIWVVGEESSLQALSNP